MGKEKKIVAQIEISATGPEDFFRKITYTKVYDQETSFRTLVNWVENKLKDLDEVHGVKHAVVSTLLSLED
jgi:hypothetical protein